MIRKAPDTEIFTPPAELDQATARAEPPTLDTIPTTDIQRELDRRQRELAGMLRKRAKLQLQLRELETGIVEMGGGEYLGRNEERRPLVPPPPTAPRHRDLATLTLKDALVRTMAIGDVVSPTDAAQRLLNGGYKSGCKNLAGPVTTTLSKDKRFRRVGRGRYERMG